MTLLQLFRNLHFLSQGLLAVDILANYCKAFLWLWILQW